MTDDLLDLTPLLALERSVLLDLLRGLSAEQWERPTECPAWSVQGIALHVLGDDLSLLTRQRDASTDSLTIYALDHPGATFRALLDGFNEQWVTASRFLSTELIIELLRLVGEWSDEFYRTVGLATTSREPVGFFAETDPSPYWQVIAREYVERFVHHSQIRRALGAAELDGGLVTGAARVVMHALSAWLRDFAAPEGATVAFDLGGAGSWTWRRNRDGWSVHDGVPDVPSARVDFAPEHVVALLSRGLSAAHARECLTISGDDALGGRALDLVAPILGG